MSDDADGDDETVKLPPGLDLLWGRRDRGRKGPKPGLSVDAIVESAIAVADAEGLAAVSMARVARELGFTTMSLYRHVDNKDELLQLMWNASAAGAPSIEGEGWRARLRSWAMEQWRMLKRRQWILEMPIVSPPAGPNSLAWVEQAMASMGETSLSEAEKLGVVGLVSSYTLGEARMSYDTRRSRGRGEELVDYAAVLRAVVDVETYPALHRAAWSGEADDPDGVGEEEGFRFGLERILDGVQAMVSR
ncbi:MAG: TetR/AcrR family transcriptional regulator [Nocardioidaceae bacterium]